MKKDRERKGRNRMKNTEKENNLLKEMYAIHRHDVHLKVGKLLLQITYSASIGI